MALTARDPQSYGLNASSAKTFLLTLKMLNWFADISPASASGEVQPYTTPALHNNAYITTLGSLFYNFIN